MAANPSQIHDVVIAGAGPVGLFLACELALVGVDVLVLEQAESASSPLKTAPFGVRGLSMPTLQALDRRGFLDALRTAQHRSASAIEASAHWLQQKRRPAGHFAGISFFAEDVDASRWPYHQPGPAGVNLAVDMQSLEAVLAERACALGVRIRRGCGVDGFVEDDEGVSVRAGGETFPARWLVGCDGGRGTVRKLGGFAFVGTDPEFTGYSVEAELADPDVLPPGRNYTSKGIYTYARPGVISMVEFDGGVFHRSGPITREHVQAVLGRVSGVDVAIAELRHAATWTDRARQASEYRRGKVLLTGDAAHTHSPFGGQGLNLGLGDAMNLGWKLAATVRGHAPPGLLDTYAAERRPEGARVLDWSRAQVALMRPTPSTRAIAAIVGDLMATRDGATYFAERVWGVSLRYDLGGAHPLVGRSLPDLELGYGTRVGDLMRSGRGLLLDFASDPRLEALAGGWRGRIDYLASAAAPPEGSTAVLIRPDGFIAWARGRDHDDDDALRSMERWFGDPL